MRDPRSSNTLKRAREEMLLALGSLDPGDEQLHRAIAENLLLKAYGVSEGSKLNELANAGARDASNRSGS